MEGNLTPEQVVERIARTCGGSIIETRIGENREGAKKNPNYNIWIDIERDSLKAAIKTLMEIHYPHFSVISGNDDGDTIRLLYHFSIYYGTKHGEYTVTFGVRVPKDDPTIPTISDLIPGTVFSEREKQEFLGIRVIGIPDSRRLFLPEDFPEGVYPWRKDETGIPDSMIKNLWEVGRPTDRPAPPAGDKEMCELEKDDGTPVPHTPKEKKEGQE
jgi:membrane-bound hydrogenase subunit beta